MLSNSLELSALSPATASRLAARGIQPGPTQLPERSEHPTLIGQIGNTASIAKTLLETGVSQLPSIGSVVDNLNPVNVVDQAGNKLLDIWRTYSLLMFFSMVILLGIIGLVFPNEAKAVVGQVAKTVVTKKL